MSITTKELDKQLSLVLNKDKVVYLHGSSGIGKSDIVKHYADKNNLELIDIRLNQFDPLDLNGLPKLTKDKNKFLHVPLNIFPTEKDKLPKGKKGWLLFFDELSQATPDVQNAAFKILLDRKIGMHNLHKKIKIVCAGNDINENASVFELPAPLISRMIHFYIKSDVESWVKWARNNKILPIIISFIQQNPDSLSNQQSTDKGEPYSTSRSWAMLSDVLVDVKEDDYESIYQIVEGTVGKESAGAFLVYAEFAEKIPNIPKILKGKVKRVNLNEPSLNILVVESIVYYLKESSSDIKLSNAFNYISKMDDEFIVLFIIGLRDANVNISNNKKIRSWVIKNKDSLI